MARRTVEIKVVIDLLHGSKEAHEVTISRIAEKVGQTAVNLFEAKGYQVREAKVNHLMHYVRHDVTKTLIKPVVRRLKRVS